MSSSNPSSSKREQLLNTAIALFYREGYHATGIDRILAESGVAKMTLYKHFKSKDELIMAALEARHARTLQRFGEALPPPSRELILSLFDRLHVFLQEDDFSGCAFIHAAAEFHDRDHPIHRQASEHKGFIEAFMCEQLQRLGAAEPGKLARQLQYLMEGVLVMAHMHGPADQALEAREAADTLLRGAGL